MKEYRCTAKKPNGKDCNTLFFKQDERGLEVKCQRCNSFHRYEEFGQSSSAAQSEEWAPLTV